MTEISKKVMQKHSRPCRVLMLGPALTDKGGIATIEELYFQAWDYSRYSLIHIGTCVNGSKLLKLLMAARALVLYCYYLIVWRPDILHVHFSARASFFRKAVFVLLARLWGIKIILHCHTSAFDVFYQEVGTWGKVLIRSVLNQADWIIALSTHWVGILQEMQLRVPISVLSNPVRYHAPSARLNHSRQVVLTLGRLGKPKGTYDILKAIPHVLKTSPDVEFWLGGDGDLDQVKSILAAEPWGQHVRLLGWVTGEEKDRVLSSATLFILPSYNEGMPLAVLEAMAYGLPVISTPVGGIPEIIVDGKTGLLVNPGDVQALSDRISLLLRNPDLCQKLGTNARRLVEDKFLVDVIMQQLYSLYDTLLKEAAC
jgi:glycosyltransferase involved in cell wall biosynthesis